MAKRRSSRKRSFASYKADNGGSVQEDSTEQRYPAESSASQSENYFFEEGNNVHEYSLDTPEHFLLNQVVNVRRKRKRSENALEELPSDGEQYVESEPDRECPAWPSDDEDLGVRWARAAAEQEAAHGEASVAKSKKGKERARPAEKGKGKAESAEKGKDTAPPANEGEETAPPAKKVKFDTSPVKYSEEKKMEAEMEAEIEAKEAARIEAEEEAENANTLRNTASPRASFGSQVYNKFAYVFTASVTASKAYINSAAEWCTYPVRYMFRERVLVGRSTVIAVLYSANGVKRRPVEIGGPENVRSPESKKRAELISTIAQRRRRDKWLKCPSWSTFKRPEKPFGFVFESVKSMLKEEPIPEEERELRKKFPEVFLLHEQPEPAIPPSTPEFMAESVPGAYSSGIQKLLHELHESRDPMRVRREARRERKPFPYARPKLDPAKVRPYYQKSKQRLNKAYIHLERKKIWAEAAEEAKRRKFDERALRQTGAQNNDLWAPVVVAADTDMPAPAPIMSEANEPAPVATTVATNVPALAPTTSEANSAAPSTTAAATNLPPLVSVQASVDENTSENPGTATTDLNNVETANTLQTPVIATSGPTLPSQLPSQGSAAGNALENPGAAAAGSNIQETNDILPTAAVVATVYGTGLPPHVSLQVFAGGNLSENPGTAGNGLDLQGTTTTPLAPVATTCGTSLPPQIPVQAAAGAIISDNLGTSAGASYIQETVHSPLTFNANVSLPPQVAIQGFAGGNQPDNLGTSTLASNIQQINSSLPAPVNASFEPNPLQDILTTGALNENFSDNSGMPASGFHAHNTTNPSTTLVVTDFESYLQRDGPVRRSANADLAHNSGLPASSANVQEAVGTLPAPDATSSQIEMRTEIPLQAFAFGNESFANNLNIPAGHFNQPAAINEEPSDLEKAPSASQSKVASKKVPTRPPFRPEFTLLERMDQEIAYIRGGPRPRSDYEQGFAFDLQTPDLENDFDNVSEPVNEELSNLEDAPPARPSKNVHWGINAFNEHLDQPVFPRVQHYIKGETIGYNARERYDSPFRYPRQNPDAAAGNDWDESIMETPSRFPNAPNSSPANASSDLVVQDEEVAALGLELSNAFADKARKTNEEIADAAAKEAQKNEEKQAHERERTEKAREAEKRRKKAEDEELRHQVEEEEARRQAAEEEARLALEVKLPVSEAVKSLITGLSPEWSKRLEKAMQSHKSSTLANFKGVELTRRDFGTLLPEHGEGVGWLNDEVVNAYLGSIVDHYLEQVKYERRSGLPPPLHAFNSAWYNNVSKKGAAAVSGWSKRAKFDGIKLLQVNTILIPINDANHWTLLVVSGTHRTIWYLDSLGGEGRKYIAAVRSWLQVEMGGHYRESDWTVLRDPSGVQLNGLDCGVFTCFNALAVVRGLKPSAVVSGADMGDGRRLIAATLINGGFAGEFGWSGATV